MNRQIVAFHQDSLGALISDLTCGHDQHVGHWPAWTSRPWVVTPEGRPERIGQVLDCKLCDAPRGAGGGSGSQPS